MKRHLPFLILLVLAYFLVHATGILRAHGTPDLVELADDQKISLHLAWKMGAHSFGILEIKDDPYNPADAYATSSTLMYGFDESGTETYFLDRDRLAITSQYVIYAGPAWPMMLMLTTLPLTMLFFLRRPLQRTASSLYHWFRPPPPPPTS